MFLNRNFQKNLKTFIFSWIKDVCILDFIDNCINLIKNKTKVFNINSLNKKKQSPVLSGIFV